MTPTRPRLLLTMVTATLAAAGCSSRDERLAEYAGRSVRQQAAQNQEIARQSREVTRQGQDLARAARELVEADAQSRRELIRAQEKLQGELHAERSGLDRRRQEVDAGRDALERERRALAEQRGRDPVVAEAIRGVGLLLACLLPLAAALAVLRRMPGGGSDAEALGELLVHELTAEEPLLLPRPGPPRPALGHRADAAGPGPAGADDPADADRDPA